MLVPGTEAMRVPRDELKVTVPKATSVVVS
jgi:hypothetical protein